MRNVGTEWERSHSENRPVRAAESSLECTSLRREGRDVRSPARAVWGVLCAIAPLKKWECKKSLPHRIGVMVALPRLRDDLIKRLPVHRGAITRIHVRFRSRGNCFRARRTGNGQSGGGRRGVRGSGGSEGWRKDEIRMKKDEWGGQRGKRKEISG